MEERKLSYRSAAFLSWPFLLSLFGLILNDIWLKYEYPGWLTGKLSDFFGLFVVGCVIVVAIGSKHQFKFLLVAAFTFVWWKSPASESFIVFCQSVGYPIGRVVDYSDLLALPMLFISRLWVCHITQKKIDPMFIRSIAKLSVLGITCLAVMGTSYIPLKNQYTIRKYDKSQPIELERAKAVIFNIAERNGLEFCEKCDIKNHRGVYSGSSVDLRYSFTSDLSGVEFVVTGIPDSIIFLPGSGSESEMAKIKSELKQEFAEKFSGMEFVIHLSQPGI